jgi:electron transport complex protein RnfD
MPPTNPSTKAPSKAPNKASNRASTRAPSLRRLMGLVMLTLVPGTIGCTIIFGFGVLLNLVVAIVTCIITEACILALRRRPLAATLLDGSAAVTGWLLAVTLSPWLPLHLVVFGAVFAIAFGKHVYGGLGHNPFNPAMVGYVVLILSFPLAMNTWPAIDHATVTMPALIEPDRTQDVAVDQFTGPTPLDTFKFRGARTVDEVWSDGFGVLSGVGWQWINAAFLLGGAALLILRLSTWHAPAAMLVSLAFWAAVFYDGGSSSSLGSPLMHLFAGGTMLAAFFIVTDPVTAPRSKQGLLLFGAGVGSLTFLIRSVGAYPDGIAFAVLLMNAASPLIDRALAFKRITATAEAE